MIQLTHLERLEAENPVALHLADADRLPLEPGQAPQMLSARFRTLGCRSLTGAVDHDAGASMEMKKQEGNF